jgi:hypothetical protein
MLIHQLGGPRLTEVDREAGPWDDPADHLCVARAAISRGQSRLFPAIKAYLEEWDAVFSEISDRQGHRGGFSVELKAFRSA